MYNQKETELLTCNDVRISVFALVFWVLRVLSCVFIQARISSNFFVFLAETNILKQQIQCQYRTQLHVLILIEVVFLCLIQGHACF